MYGSVSFIFRIDYTAQFSSLNDHDMSMITRTIRYVCDVSISVLLYLIYFLSSSNFYRDELYCFTLSSQKKTGFKGESRFILYLSIVTISQKA